MEVFYHGTCRLFDTFDPNRLGSGEGKSKFGHGIYITSSIMFPFVWTGVKPS